MKKSVLVILVLLAFCEVIFAQTVVETMTQSVQSPDGAYLFTCYQKEIAKGNKQIYYALTYKGKVVVRESELGVLIENNTFESALGIPNDTCGKWCENLTFLGIKRLSRDTVWTPVYGEHSQIRDNYNELVLTFRKGVENLKTPDAGFNKNKTYFMNLIVRAYNQGVAFRYHFPEPTNGLFLHIVGEQTQFAMPEGTLGYYEEWAQGPYSLLPLKDWKGQSERPLTMSLGNGLWVALAEAQLTDYARMKFSLSATSPNTLQASLYSSVDVIPSYFTPWRVIMAGEKPIDLIANKEIILNLNSETPLTDVSWIKPGKVIRVARLNQTEAKKCVDFAAQHRLQYIHLDSGWYGSEIKKESSALRVALDRDLNIPELTEYAASKGIGVWLYVNQRALAQQLDSILPLYKQWGVKGLKFGFVQVGNQHWTTWLHNAVRKCAEYGLMVDIHDEYRPTGFSRTFPNLMTQEGVRGNEEMPDANHNTILPFTRFLAGPADYTICYYNSRIKNTHAHQLALSVVYYSPIQFLYWYDQPSAYQGEPEIEFFDQVKTVWDDTRIIDGNIGEYITIARRSGAEWFVGAITNTQARVVDIPTKFLEKDRNYLVKIYQDDESQTTRTKVRVTARKIKGGDNLNFALQARGGVALHITALKK